MVEEPSTKRHQDEPSDKSSNLVDVHVPGEKREYTKTLTGVELHGKETLEFVCTNEPDKADEIIFRIRRSTCSSYPHIIGVDTTRENPSSSAGFEAISSAGSRATNKALQLTVSSSAVCTGATTIDHISSAFPEHATIS